MRTSLLLLLLLFAGVVGFGFGDNRASAWYVLIACAGFLVVLQLGYFIGAVVTNLHD